MIILTYQVVKSKKLMLTSVHQKLHSSAIWDFAPWKRSLASRTTSTLNAIQDSSPSYNRTLTLISQSNKLEGYKASKKSCNSTLRKDTKLKLFSWLVTYLIGIFIAKVTGPFHKKSSFFWLRLASWWQPSLKKIHHHHLIGW